MASIPVRNRKINAVCAAAALLLLVLVQVTGLAQYLRNQNYDMLFYLRGETPPPEDVVIVAIDELSFDDIGIPWPWPRGIHAALIDSLAEAGARTIALDIVFPESSSPAADASLRDAIAGHGNVILAADIQQVREAGYTLEKRVIPAASITDANTTVASIVLGMDSDGILRKVYRSDGEQFSFSYLAAAKQRDPACCREVEPAGGNEHLINYYGLARQIRTVSYYQALDPQTYLPDDALRDKLVFVGLSIQTMVDRDNQENDYFMVPLSRFNGGMLAGVEIHATAAANFLADAFIRPVNLAGVYVVALLLAALLGVLVVRTRPLVALAAFAVLGVAAFALSLSLFAGRQLFLPVSDLLTTPGIVFGFAFLSQFYIHLSDKKFVRGLFSAYVAPEILEKLEKNVSSLKLGGTKVHASILFMDVKGFTTLSESLKSDPEALVNILNMILGRVSDRVISNHGVVNDFVGDAVMGVWGSPVETDNHADMACRTALEIAGVMQDINRELNLDTPLTVRVGVNSGEVISGNVGSERKMKFTVLGDDVNLASRLEGTNNFYHTSIIISGATAALLKEDFTLRELDDIRVKSKEKPVKILELGNPALDAGKLALFRAARAAYIQRDWTRAEQLLEEFLSMVPNDGPAYVLLERCRAYRDNPPPEDWGGIHTFTEK